MVGGGSLSLPLAFQKTGNALLGPVLLLVTAGITEFCFRVLVDAARTVTPVNNQHDDDRRPSRDSYESIAAAAFGKTTLRFCTVLVTLMCFFGIVGYAVLLRDMLEPVTDAVFPDVHRGGNCTRQCHHAHSGFCGHALVHDANTDCAQKVRGGFHVFDSDSGSLHFVPKLSVHHRSFGIHIPQSRLDGWFPIVPKKLERCFGCTPFVHFLLCLSLQLDAGAQ